MVIFQQNKNKLDSQRHLFISGQILCLLTLPTCNLLLNSPTRTSSLFLHIICDFKLWEQTNSVHDIALPMNCFHRTRTNWILKDIILLGFGSRILPQKNANILFTIRLAAHRFKHNIKTTFKSLKQAKCISTRLTHSPV